MQKKIIALAIASALVAPAAFADTSEVSIYGVADASYDMIKTGNSTAGVTGITSNRVSSNSSRVGLKGAEDLGDGLSAIWQVETQVNFGDTTGTGTSVGTRDTFAGLSGKDAGTVLLGRHDTPYKMSTRKFDLFGDGIADNRSIMGGGVNASVGFDGRQNQVVAYVSPKLGDMFTGAIAYVNVTPANSVSTQAKASATSLAGMFDIAGGFYGALAYESHALDTVVPGGKEKATKLGLGYTMDAFNVNFAYEKTSDNLVAVTGANKFGHSDYYLSGKYNFTSNDAFKLAYTKANTVNGVSGSDAKQFSLGYDHSMSKRTTLYALYSKLSNGSAAGYQLGAGTSSVGGASTIAGVGASPSVFAFGMRHIF